MDTVLQRNKIIIFIKRSICVDRILKMVSKNEAEFHKIVL